MSNNPVQENANIDDHVVNMQVYQGRLTLMHKKLADSPEIPSRSTGWSLCSIFRVPKNLVDINRKCYQPVIVSIGPYHRGEKQVIMVEDHKWRFLNGLLKRTEGKGLTLEDYLRAVQPLEDKARECYSPAIEIPRDEFIEMLVLDGCFVIELFRKYGDGFAFEADDPLFSLSSGFSLFRKDLIRLENQIPFFVLDHLFNLTKMPTDVGTLSHLTLMFFSDALQLSNKVIHMSNDLQGKHLLDFLRTSFIPKGFQQSPGRNQKNCMKPDVIPCISKLRRAGIKLRARSSDSFLVVNFRHGVIEMPTITVDDFMKVFLLNCVAYEQCDRDCPSYMTAYAKLLDCLINTAKDVEHLCDENIIENRLGTNGEVAGFINKMGKEVQYFDAYKYQLSGLFEKVNNYYNNPRHVQWASFKNRYFNSPWSFISMVAATVLLILTVTQTLYTVISYVRPR